MTTQETGPETFLTDLRTIRERARAKRSDGAGTDGYRADRSAGACENQYRVNSNMFLHSQQATSVNTLNKSD